MTNEQFQRETVFLVSMNSLFQMLRAKVLTEAEYEMCRKMMIEKYNPPISKIVSN